MDKSKFLKKVKKDYLGILYISPMIIGIMFFTFVPMVASLWYSLHEYYIYMETPINFGFQNYIKAFTLDWPEVSNSLQVTFVFSIVSISVNIVLSYILALFLNQKLKGMNFFRSLYYVPCIIPAVVSGLLWNDITSLDTGYLNLILNTLGLPSYGFYTYNETVLPTLIFMGMFSLGGNMVLWLAQIKNIPESLYEVAKLEGASYLRVVLRIVIPMSTPMIFYILVTNMIGSLQTFSNVYMLITPANQRALNFFVVYAYNQAFGAFNMGYACALSWILFAIIGILTFVLFKTSKWVFYGEEV